MNTTTAKMHSVQSHQNFVKVIKILAASTIGMTIKIVAQAADLTYSQARGVLASALLDGWVTTQSSGSHTYYFLSNTCPNSLGIVFVGGPRTQLKTSTPTTALSTTCTQQELQAIEKKWLDGQEFDSTRLAVECAGHLNSILFSMEQLGRRLIALKEVLGHGGFGKFMQDPQLPISSRMVNRFMAIARAHQ